VRSGLTPCSRVKMPSEFGNDELVQAHPFGFGLAGERGMQRLRDAHVKLAAVLAMFSTDLGLGKAID